MKNLKIMSAAMAAMMTISALSISALADELVTAVIPADRTISVETPAAELPKEEQPVMYSSNVIVVPGRYWSKI